MTDISSQKSDISFASAQADSSDSDEDIFDDAVEAGEWQEDTTGMVFNEFDASASGPKHNLEETASVLDYFKLFWTLQIVNIIVQETNRYANALPAATEPWVDICADELNAFISIFIVMGIKKLPSVSMYWSENEMVKCPWISKVMSRTRFYQINRVLHLADNDLAIPKGFPGHNPLFKVQPLIDHMKTKFSQWFYPGKCISIDEAMIAFNGRLSFKQYIPSKPTKWGIKVWEACDSKNGYCLDFNVYTGKNPAEVSPFGVGYDVISELSSRYFNKFHCVFFDRFFTGVDILEHLLFNGTYGCGTCRSNRRGLPKRLKNVKLRRGETKVFKKFDSNLMLTLFKDRKLVHMLSTNCQNAILPTGKPEVIEDFNKNMGGVDLNDQLCMYYKAGRPSHKWWR